MKIHADVTRIPATRKRVSSRDVFWASRKATIGTAVRYPSQRYLQSIISNGVLRGCNFARNFKSRLGLSLRQTSKML